MYHCLCGLKFETADKYSAHVVECPKASEEIRKAKEFTSRYTAKVRNMNKNEACCLAGMALTQARHLGMSVEELHQLVSISVSTYEKEVEG